jgi:GT2 family glycosyltransferase
MIQLVLWDAQHDGRLGQWLSMRSGSGGIVEARNQVHEQVADLDASIQWLFWIDADMGFEADALDRLLAAADPVERPVVGGLCFAWKEIQPDGMSGYHCVSRPTIFDWVEHPDGHKRFTGVVDYPRNELVQCAGTGTAFLLVHRSVIEAVGANVEEQGRWFDRIKGSDGSKLGEDISFCVRVTAAGFPIHVHTGIRTNHLKEAWISESVFDSERVVAAALNVDGS